MDIFKIETAFSDDGNSPWDALWYNGDDEDLESLECQMRLAPIWRAPPVRLERRIERPEFYRFQLYYAATKKAFRVLSALVQESAEFLPLRLSEGKRLFAIHPLLRIDLDANAVVDRNKVSGNITVVRKYSFVHGQIDNDMHIFQVLQAKGSAARDGGFALPEILVSSRFRDLCEENGFRGIRFEKI